MFVQFWPSADVWIWNDLPYAPSHCSTTWLMVAGAPRAMRIHCGALHWLLQRGPSLPSLTKLAPTSSAWADEAGTGLPCGDKVSGARANGGATTTAAAVAA